jgi:nucleosome binding factor SPN SPT16 subunit
MNKAAIGYVLIALGALDLIIWFLNDYNFGWLELVVGVNYFSQYGAWAMMVIGFQMSRNVGSVEQNVISDSQSSSEEKSIDQIEVAVDEVQNQVDQDSEEQEQNNYDADNEDYY